MGKQQPPINWTQIEYECPEFFLSPVEFANAVVAVIGVILSCILIFHFQKLMKASVFLNNLAGYDLGICLLHLYSYFFKSLTIHFQWDPISDVPFCDVSLLQMAFEQPILHFIQVYLSPGIILTVTILIVVISLFTLYRIVRVGGIENLLERQEIYMANCERSRVRLTTRKIKRTVYCMLFISFEFFILTISFLVYVTPIHYNINRNSTPKDKEIFGQKAYDFLNIAFSASRIMVYYAFCRKDIVLELPPNGLQND